MTRYTVTPQDLDRLISVLVDQGYEVMGPSVSDNVVELRPIGSLADFPRGIRDEQAPGRYQTEHSDDDEFFGYAVGPTSLKQTLLPARREVWRAHPADGTIHFRSAESPTRQIAVVGARPCDVAAVKVQDRVLLDGPFVDRDYEERRSRLFVVVVNCTRPASTCFCTSMNTGPAASSGFDIAMTELFSEAEHSFVAESGSERGELLLQQLFSSRRSTPTEIELCGQALGGAAAAMTRKLDTSDVHELLRDQPNHARWATIAARCLACGNCTQACPTCFCVSPEPKNDIEDGDVSFERRWDSCFSLDFSYMGGAPVRESIDSRYRQWLTHKLSTWIDQFGTSGCVGCGRCITWCPVGIDFTEEIPHFREASHV